MNGQAEERARLPLGAPTLVWVTSEREALASTRASEAKRDQKLVEQAAAGDQEAFAVLVGRYGQPILSLCYSSILDAAEAEDLAQEVFVSAWRNLRRFRGEAAFSTWLFAL